MTTSTHSKERHKNRHRELRRHASTSCRLVRLCFLEMRHVRHIGSAASSGALLVCPRWTTTRRQNMRPDDSRQNKREEQGKEGNKCDRQARRKQPTVPATVAVPWTMSYRAILTSRPLQYVLISPEAPHRSTAINQNTSVCLCPRNLGMSTYVCKVRRAIHDTKAPSPGRPESKTAILGAYVRMWEGSMGRCIHILGRH